MTKCITLCLAVFVRTLWRLVLVCYAVGSLASAQTTPPEPLAAMRAPIPPPSNLPPVTVADLIELTRIGSNGVGGAGGGVVASPDGTLVAVIVQRGNLERNVRDFSLLLFRTVESLQSPKVDTLFTLSTSSNRPAISQVQWFSNNTTLLFLGERPGELPQVYTFDIRERKLKQRTRAKTRITSFQYHAASDVLVYFALPPRDNARLAAMRARGFVVSDNIRYEALYSGDWLGEQEKESETRERPAFYTVRQIQVIRGGAEASFSLPDDRAGYKTCADGSLKLNPEGNMATIVCYHSQTLAEKVNYKLMEPRIGNRPSQGRLEVFVLDLKTGSFHSLTGAPMTGRESWMWAPDGRSIVVANTPFPRDASKSSGTETRPYVVEIDARTGVATEITVGEALQIVDWDKLSNTITLQRDSGPTEGKAHDVWYRKTAERWVSVSIPPSNDVEAPKPTLTVEEGLNEPWRLVAINPQTKVKKIVYVPNPGLLERFRFARKTVVQWRTRSGRLMNGQLYWPPGYVAGMRYPLVIQGHAFSPNHFWPEGHGQTGYAGQALANVGIFVLQASEITGRSDLFSTKLGDIAQENIEGAIAALDSQGLIDRTKVGLQGFSYTGYSVLFFLTHSKVPIAAATVHDNNDESYFQYLIATNRGGSPESAFAQQSEFRNGGLPFGESLKKWLERAPGFNLDRVNTPVQLASSSGMTCVRCGWEVYAGLRRLGKPAEMVIFPEGQHSLVKPWERMTSQQGVVDWYRFWLQGFEDPGPAKQARYAHWREMKAEWEKVKKDGADATGKQGQK